MTNFANEVARWLATNPGLFTGSSREDVLGRAYSECPVRFKAETRTAQLKGFETTLHTLGHVPRYVNAFDVAGGPIPSAGHWQLPLPEQPRTSPRLEDEGAKNRRG